MPQILGINQVPSKPLPLLLPRDQGFLWPGLYQSFCLLSTFHPRIQISFHLLACLAVCDVLFAPQCLQLWAQRNMVRRWVRGSMEEDRAIKD